MDGTDVLPGVHSRRQFQPWRVVGDRRRRSERCGGRHGHEFQRRRGRPRLPKTVPDISRQSAVVSQCIC